VTAKGTLPTVVRLASAAAEKAAVELEQRRLHLTETNQATVWLVGLASTLLALTVASPDRVRNVVGSAYATVSILLLVTVIGGATVRVAAVWIAYFSEIELSELRLGLSGLGSTILDTQGPMKLAMHWTEADIVAKFQSNFDSDYSFLLKYQTPLDECRKLYEEAYERHKQDEHELILLLARGIGAFYGWTDLAIRDWAAARVARAVGETEGTESQQERLDKALAAVSRASRWLSRARVAHHIVFTMSAVAFVAAMYFVARGLYLAP
jgi:hypothetical protein